jgi:hypothetical protein
MITQREVIKVVLLSCFAVMSGGRQNLLSADEHDEVSVDSHVDPRRQDTSCKGVVLKVVYLQCCKSLL